MCILEKQFVEIAEAKEEQRVRMLLLGCGVLAHERGLRRLYRLDRSIGHWERSA
jgi:hypothetical protein